MLFGAQCALNYQQLQLQQQQQCILNGIGNSRGIRFSIGIKIIIILHYAQFTFRSVRKTSQILADWHWLDGCTYVMYLFTFSLFSKVDGRRQKKKVRRADKNRARRRQRIRFSSQSSTLNPMSFVISNEEPNNNKIIYHCALHCDLLLAARVRIHAKMGHSLVSEHTDV